MAPLSFSTLTHLALVQGHSLEHIAARAKVSQKTVLGWLGGHRTPKLRDERRARMAMNLLQMSLGAFAAC